MLGERDRRHARIRLSSSASEDVISADIDIHGEDGRLAAQIRGIHIKRAASGGGAQKLYRPEWRSVTPDTARGVSSKAVKGSLVVTGEDFVAASKLAAALNNSGLTAKAAKPGAVLHERTTGVVWLADRQASEEPGRELARTSSAVLSLAQTLLQRSSPAPPQLWLVTQGAVAVDLGDAGSGLFQSPIWGMARTIAMEHPELTCVRIDLDPADPDFETLAKEIAGGDGEEEIAFRSGVRFARRLASKFVAPREPSHWTIPARGSVDHLALAKLERRAPNAGEVEIEVETSALNFRDVLNVLGMYPGDAGLPGAEFCGRIVRVGEGERGYRLGNSVMGIAWGSFASFVTTATALVMPVPEDWTSVSRRPYPTRSSPRITA